jgi:cation diffusion facilitator family transporter
VAQRFPLQTALQNFRVQRWIVAIAIILFAFKMFAWWKTGSVSILTDALESTVNVVAGIISLYSLFVAAKPRDEDHPYGHGKAEFVSAAVEGSLIFVAGGVIIYEAILNFIEPHELKQLDIGILLISATALINWLAGSWCVRVGKKNNSLALIASGKHLRSDTWSTVGIVVGLVLMYFLRWPWLDSAVALVFALIIMYTGVVIVRNSLAGIMDEADRELLQKMVNSLQTMRRANWIDLHNVRIIKYGSVLHLDCHLTVPWYLNVHEAHQEVDALSQTIKAEFGESVELFVHSDGCLDFSCGICTKQDCPVRKAPFQKQVQWTIENISSNIKHRVDTSTSLITP